LTLADHELIRDALAALAMLAITGVLAVARWLLTKQLNEIHKTLKRVERSLPPPADEEESE
jgi:hypothetical protein